MPPSTARSIGFNSRVNCEYCRSGKDPPRGKGRKIGSVDPIYSQALICESCVASFQIQLCSNSYQKYRRSFLRMQPYCRGCLKNSIRGKIHFSLPIPGDSVVAPLPAILLWVVSTVDTVYICYMIGIEDVSDRFTTAQISYRPPIVNTPIIDGKFPLGALPPLTIATVLDHIRPWRTHPTQFLDPDNHQPLCRDCHSVKTILEEGGFGNKRNPPPLVVLPPTTELLN